MPIREMSARLHSWYCYVACLKSCQTTSFPVQSRLYKICRVGAQSVIVWHQWPERDSLRPLFLKNGEWSCNHLIWITNKHSSFECSLPINCLIGAEILQGNTNNVTFCLFYFLLSQTVNVKQELYRVCYKVFRCRNEGLTVYFQAPLLQHFIHKKAAAEFSLSKMTQHEHNYPGPFSYLCLLCN